jgi:hypothetical protein
VNVGLGSWVLGLGSWVLGLGSWVLGLGDEHNSPLPPFFLGGRGVGGEGYQEEPVIKSRRCPATVPIQAGLCQTPGSHCDATLPVVPDNQRVVGRPRADCHLPLHWFSVSRSSFFACSPARLLLDFSTLLCHTINTNATIRDTPVCATLSSYTCAACSRGMTGRHDPLPVGSP